MENKEVMMDAMEDVAESSLGGQMVAMATVGVIMLGIYTAGKFIGKKVLMPMIEPKVRSFMAKRREKREEAERIKNAKEVEVANDEE